MPFRKTDIFLSHEFDIRIEIIDFLKEGRIKTFYSRKGIGEEAVYHWKKLLPYLLDEKLYKKI